MGVLTVATLQRVQDKREIVIKDFKYRSTENQTNVTSWSRHSATPKWSHLRHTRHKFKAVLPIRTGDGKQTKCHHTRNACEQIPARHTPVSLDQSEHILAKIPATQVIRAHCVFQQPP